MERGLGSEEPMQATEARFGSLGIRCAHPWPCHAWCWPGKPVFDRGHYRGYGAFSFPGMPPPIPASRVALMLNAGAGVLPLTTGKDRHALTVCHMGDFPPWCHPAPLLLGTQSDKAKDAKQQGFFVMDRHKSVQLPDGRLLHRLTALPEQRTPAWGAYLRQMRRRQVS